MKSIDKILAFAKQIAKEDQEKMEDLEAWENYIAPLFKEKFGLEFRPNLYGLYSPQIKAWLRDKKIEFESNKDQLSLF